MICTRPTPHHKTLLELCAFCWERFACRSLRSTGGWNVGVCNECHGRHESEPALKPIPKETPK
jgi:hypothetical protein